MMKFVHIMVLFTVLIKCIQHVFADSISCSVPEVENGEIGRLDVLNSRSGEGNFIKALVGENVRSNETLFLRCREGFYPTKDSKFLESNLIEVTCKGETWPDIPQCKQTHCTTTPPSGKNALPIVGNRQHGYTIWYSCTTRYAAKLPGNVTCHFGSWIGIVPKCFQKPCSIEDLNYPGLIKPSEKYLDSDESFDVHCQNGFIKAASAEKINCNEGEWDITQNPCTKDKEHRPSSNASSGNPPPFQEVHPTVNVVSSDQQNTDRECFCTYDYENNFVKAKMGHKILKRGDKIMPGETVSFECKFVCGVLSWQNGLRFHGSVNMVCSTCRNWISEDLPSCNSIVNSDAVIGYEEDLKILPGGIVEIRKGESYQFTCSSRLGQPQWDYGGRKDVSEINAQIRGHGNDIYLSYLDVTRARKGHRGKYECFTKDEFGDRRASSILELQVDDFDRRCPPIDGLGIFGLYYDNDRRINSTAVFICRDPDKRVEGLNVVTCLPNGTWSGAYPTCVGSRKCVRFPRSRELIVRYSLDMSVGSIASFHCLPPNRNLIGHPTSVCQENGSWSNPLPSCEGNMRCTRFPESPGLVVRYSLDTSTGSIATFHCLSLTRKLTGRPTSLCQENGTWSNPLPSCEGPKCSIHDLAMALPENVEPDMTDVTGEFVSSGSEVKLKCNDDNVMDGNSKAQCKENGIWEFGNYQCVLGCKLDVDSSSHLLVQPVKDTYRFGEFILLSCPPGREMTNSVERLMCMGSGWTDPLPSCKESKRRQG